MSADCFELPLCNAPMSVSSDSVDSPQSTADVVSSASSQEPLDVALLRSTPLSVVLHRGGFLLKDNHGSGEIYALSSQTDSIDSFISHSWSSGRWQKYLSLCIHFNVRVAFASSVLVGFLLAALGASKLLFFAKLKSEDNIERAPNGPYAMVLCSLTFWLVLLFCRDVVPRGCLHTPSVFLDKVFVHQLDGDLKKQGVAHLSMFLFFSADLVILESDDYFERLWTVYELATFLTVQPRGRVVSLPENLPPVVFVTNVIITITTLVNFTMKTGYVNNTVQLTSSVVVVVFFIPGIFTLVLLMRRWVGDRERKVAFLGHFFRVEQAWCSNEDDRVPVMTNIARLLQDMGGLRQGGTLQEATQIFNNLVRDKVPLELRASIGCSLFPYSHVLIVSMSLLGHFFDAVGSEIAAGTPVAQGVPRCWFWFAWYTAGVPVAVPIVSLLARRLLCLRGGMNMVFLLVVLASAHAIQTVFVQFRILAVSTSLLVLNIIVTILMATVAFLIIQPCSRATVQKHRTNNEDSLAEARRLRLPIVLRSAARSAVIGQTSSFGSSSQSDVAEETSCQSVINLRALAASTGATKRISL